MPGPKVTSEDFDLEGFLPYRLNQAAEHVSRNFQALYRREFGMTRPEWRVLAHLGQNETLTARDICDRARMHKTEVSRAISALEKRRWLTRQRDQADRRLEHLCLTSAGRRAFRELGTAARKFETGLMAKLPEIDAQNLMNWLAALSR